jgi:hypothetical protein
MGVTMPTAKPAGSIPASENPLSTTRRLALLGATAIPTTALWAPSMCIELDPIFAKIETYERALAIRDQASGEWGSVLTSDHEAYAAAEDKFRDAADALAEAEGDLLTTVPTTAAGAAAALRLAASILHGSEADEGIFEPLANGDRLAAGANFLPMIADTIARLSSVA